MHINILIELLVTIISYKSSIMRVLNKNVPKRSHVNPENTNYANPAVRSCDCVFPSSAIVSVVI